MENNMTIEKRIMISKFIEEIKRKNGLKKELEVEIKTDFKKELKQQRTY